MRCGSDRARSHRERGCLVAAGHGVEPKRALRPGSAHDAPEPVLGAVLTVLPGDQDILLGVVI